MNFARDPSRRRSKVRLQLTSMIDVIFLLLIFFMVTTTIAAPESQLTSGLRAERQSGRASDFPPLVVEAMQSGGRSVFRIGERVLGSKAELTAVLEKMPKSAGVFVKVADDVNVEWAAAALQACSDAGFVRVTYVPAS